MVFVGGNFFPGSVGELEAFIEAREISDGWDEGGFERANGLDFEGSCYLFNRVVAVAPGRGRWFRETFLEVLEKIFVAGEINELYGIFLGAFDDW